MSSEITVNTPTMNADHTHCTGNPIDDKNLSSHQPEMLVFPNMSDFYSRWSRSLQRNNVHIRLNTRLISVVRRSRSKGVTVKLVKIRSRSIAHLEEDKEPCESEETFDEIIFCIVADAALEALGAQATWIERKVLGGAKFSNDSTVTHCVSDCKTSMLARATY